MKEIEKIAIKEKLTNYLFSKNRIGNVLSFVFGFILAHCTDFSCVIKSFGSLLGK